MRVLFVCTGNICRSPTAEGVLRHRLQKAGLTHVTVDSAGMHAFHTGERPDPRTIRVAKARGVDLETITSRQVTARDFEDFDLILALDAGHEQQLKRLAPKGSRATVALFLEHAGHPQSREVPDPYYGDAADFEYVLDLIEDASDRLIALLRDAPRA